MNTYIIRLFKRLQEVDSLLKKFESATNEYDNDIQAFGEIMSYRSNLNQYIIKFGNEIDKCVKDIKDNIDLYDNENSQYGTERLKLPVIEI